MSEKKGMFDFTANYVICIVVVLLMLVWSLRGGGGSYNCPSVSIGVLAQISYRAGRKTFFVMNNSYFH